MNAAPAGIEFVTEGSWNAKAAGGEWSPGGCGCGGSCGGNCKGNCGCGGSCGGQAKAPSLPDYDGELTVPGFYPEAVPARADRDRPTSWLPPHARTRTVGSGEGESAHPWFGQTTPHETDCRKCEDLREECIGCFAKLKPTKDYERARQACISGICAEFDKCVKERLLESNGKAGCPGPVNPPPPFWQPPPPTPMCGPDVTQWLMKTMAENAKEVHNEVIGFGIALFMLPEPAFAYFLETLLAKAAVADWNYNATPYASADCPKTAACERTVTLCGRCLSDDVPEDINFGAMASRYFISRARAGQGADLFAQLRHGEGKDSDEAHAAFDVGFGLTDTDFTDRAAFCAKINGGPKPLKSKPGSERCKPCSEVLLR